MKEWGSVRLFALACLMLFPVLTKAQLYHRLTAEDFTGMPVDNGFLAYTNCYVNYSYQATRHNGNYNIDFDVRLTLNNSKSWINFDRITDRALLSKILTHEQGHYNIAYLMKNDLYSVLTRHRYSANYQAEITALFKQVENKYHKLNDDYEMQTRHMADAVSQEKWNKWFNTQLSNVETADNTDHILHERFQ